MTGETITALSGLVSSAAGAAGQFAGAAQMGGAASALDTLSEDEAASLLATGASQARLLRQRAWANQQDISFLAALSATRQRALHAQEAEAVGKVIAESAGSGIDPMSGSPLLAQLTTSIELSKAMAGERLVTQVSQRRLQFEAEAYMTKAQDVLDTAHAEATAGLRLRSAQAAQIRQKQLQTILAGVGTLTSPNTVKTAADLFRTKTQPIT